MDWTGTLERNRDALRGIVAGLFALLGLAEGGAVSAVPRPLYLAVLRVLRPAESALRRLIVIVARSLEAKPRPTRPMPSWLVLPSGRGGRVSFQLFDSRKRFGGRRAGRMRSSAQPRLHLFPAGPPLVPLFGAGAPAAVALPAPPERLADARPLARRLEALRLALEDLPRQARRLARWRARRMSMPEAKFTSPLRPGRAPGQRRRPEHPVDRVLEECHWVARLALKPDTS